MASQLFVYLFSRYLLLLFVSAISQPIASITQHKTGNPLNGQHLRCLAMEV